MVLEAIRAGRLRTGLIGSLGKGADLIHKHTGYKRAVSASQWTEAENPTCNPA